jgi:hypothetical protein
MKDVSQELFIPTFVIEIGRVEEIDAPFQGTEDQLSIICFVFSQGHTTEADGAYP